MRADAGQYEGRDRAAGDARAFGNLYEEYAPAVRAFLASRGGDHGLLDDLAREVFARAWQFRGRFRADSHIRTHLLAVARNVLAEALRRDARAAMLLGDQAGSLVGPPGDVGRTPEGEAATRSREIAAAVAGPKRHLPAKQRQAFGLVHILGLTNAEAAARAGCSTTQLRDRLYRARRRLRSLLRGL
jgi:RNA polymerase sigma-70 factor (ECF subfamily)